MASRPVPAPRSRRVTYTITPTPTIKVAPASGLVGAAFSASYSTGQSGSCIPDAQFFWDGKAVGPLLKLDATCSVVLDFPAAPAPNGLGAHSLSAQACNGRCLPGTEAITTYTVTAPKPTATPVPTATPAAPSASASASVEPSASPSASASASLEPSASPGESPSEAPSAEASLGPAPSPSPSAEVTAAPTPSPPVRDYVPALVDDVGGPDPGGGVEADVVVTNIFLTLLLLFLFALTAEIFNSTMDEHRDEVHGWWLRLMRGPFGILGRLTVPGASLTRLAGSGRLGQHPAGARGACACSGSSTAR